MTRVSIGGTLNITEVIKLMRPSLSLQGSKEPIVSMSYLVTTNKPAPALSVMRRAGQDGKLPKLGDKFSFSHAGIVSVSEEIYAMDWSASPIGAEENFPLQWRFDIGYRSPVWGQDENPTEINKAPANRAPEFRWDFMDDGRMRTTGYTSVSDSTREPITNTAGEVIPPFQTNEKLAICKIISNQRSPFFALETTGLFQNTINSTPVNLFGINVNPGYAKFLGVQQGGELWYHASGDQKGYRYWRTETQIAVGRELLYTRTPNVGTYGLKDAGLSLPSLYQESNRDVMFVSNGVPQTPPFALNADGTLKKDGTPTDDIEFFQEEPKSYASLMSALRVSSNPYPS